MARSYCKTSIISLTCRAFDITWVYQLQLGSTTCMRLTFR
jgi:hypothetical protein